MQDSKQEGEERRGTIHWRVPARTELIAMTTQAMRLRPWVPPTLVDPRRTLPALRRPSATPATSCSNDTTLHLMRSQLLTFWMRCTSIESRI